MEPFAQIQMGITKMLNHILKELNKSTPCMKTTIKLFLTARGSTTKLIKEVTKKQLNSWGVKYHELHLTKPHADFYIDDKSKISLNGSINI